MSNTPTFKNNYFIPGIGTGVYTIPDLSRILYLPYDKANRWANDIWGDQLFRQFTFKYIYEFEGQRLLSFHSLIEFFTFFWLRKLGVSTRNIVKVHNNMALQLGTPYPFACSEILSDGKRIHFSPDGSATFDGHDVAQYNIREFVTPFCQKIDFNGNRLAQRFWPLGKKSSIVVDPNHKFGQPVISGTNIFPETIFDLFAAGEKMGRIADLYGITFKQVKDAITFCKRAA